MGWIVGPKKMSIVVALLLLALPAAAAAETGGLRYTITVSKFENQAGWHGQWDIGDAWGTVMTDILNQTGRFIVLGETDMRAEALAEQDFVASGRTAQGAKSPVMGQMTPAQLLVKGAITHVQASTTGGGGGLRVGRVRVGGKKDSAEINATMYLVDSTTGQVLASTSVVGKSNRKGGTFGYSGHGWGGDVGAFKKDNTGKAVEAAVAEGVDWLVAQLPNITWRGSVVMVKNGQVYINRGSREGVTSGQTFVVGESEVIRDPDTGEVLDESVTEIARLQASTVKEKLTICTVVSGNAGAIKKGMGIQLP
jgi:curli biogenesis system outer membrane secretion channel CsgG